MIVDKKEVKNIKIIFFFLLLVMHGGLFAYEESEMNVLFESMHRMKRSEDLCMTIKIFKNQFEKNFNFLDEQREIAIKRHNELIGQLVENTEYYRAELDNLDVKKEKIFKFFRYYGITSTM